MPRTLTTESKILINLIASGSRQLDLIWYSDLNMGSSAIETLGNPLSNS